MVRTVGTLVIVLSLLTACARGPAPPLGTLTISLADARIAAAVKSALLADPDLGLRAIAVDVERGVITLSGVVRSADEAQRAVHVSGTAAGVREVKSALKVEP
jgi:osmotically-inducible protein OsmY